MYSPKNVEVVRPARQHRQSVLVTKNNDLSNHVFSPQNVSELKDFFKNYVTFRIKIKSLLEAITKAEGLCGHYSQYQQTKQAAESIRKCLGPLPCREYLSTLMSQ